VTATSRPSRLDGDVIVLEGHELRVIEVGQGDIAPSGREIVGAMRSKSPDHGNLTTLLFSAKAAVKGLQHR
jgi:hypothetical protein